LPTSLNLLFVILSIDYDRNGHSKGSPFSIEKFQILAPNADACGQHPDQTGIASLHQDWHQKKSYNF